MIETISEMLLTYGVLGAWTVYNIWTIETAKKENKELLNNLNQTIKENNQVLSRVNENMIECQRKTARST